MTYIYLCDDGSGERVEFMASSHQDAAEQYVSGGSYSDRHRTLWVHVDVQLVDSTEPEMPSSHKVTLEPIEPQCKEGSHIWLLQTEVGHGGGVIITEVCARCGLEQVTDTWAQDPETGEQGLTSVEYRHPLVGDIDSWL